MNTAQNTTEETSQITKPNASEIIAQTRHDTKKEVSKIMKKPHFFKCRNYIFESTRYNVDNILKGKRKSLSLQPKETYTQYIKRTRGINKTIMN